ncbi:MAG: hypothetical protein ACR2PZ_15350, partial [Pseudomonadales bacterium]
AQAEFGAPALYPQAHPFAVFGNPFAGAFASAYANPFAAFAGNTATGVAPGQAASGAPVGPAQGGHTVANPTNALATNQTPQGQGAAGPGGIGQFGYAQPTFLMPAFLPTGIPVMVAVSFVAFAMPLPIQGPMLGQTPQPLPQAPAAAEPPAADDDVIDAEVVDDLEETAPVAAAAPEQSDASDAVDDADAKDPLPAPAPGPVQVVNNADYERYTEEFSKESLETALVLSLTTAEGDEITLDFKQMDLLQSEAFGGTRAAGGSEDRSDSSDSSERLVNMNVVGDISAEERSAIDAVLDSVTQIANQFFNGSFAEAKSTLQAMDFDAGTLAELSLSMTMTSKLEQSGGYREGADQLDQLQNRGGQVVEALEFLATEQRRLIDQAKEVLDDGSAATLVRSLLPPLMEDTVNKLKAQVAEDATAATEAADAAEQAGDTNAEPVTQPVA